MYEELLKNIGLTENETKVYMSLLKTGLSTTSKIVKEANISGGKIYETLDKLHKKGLVSMTEISGVKHFQSTDPKALISYVQEQKNYLEEKEKKISEILPELMQINSKTKEHSSVNMLIGERSIRPLITDVFNKAKDKICAMGIRGTKDERYNNFWWHLTNTLVENNKKEALYLFSENKSDYYKKHKNLKQVKTRWTESKTPVAFDIVDDNILILSYEKELNCIHIVNKQIAESFKSFFMSMWEKAS